jgi:hypothetical protein
VYRRGERGPPREVPLWGGHGPPGRAPSLGARATGRDITSRGTGRRERRRRWGCGPPGVETPVPCIVKKMCRKKSRGKKKEKKSYGYCSTFILLVYHLKLFCQIVFQNTSALLRKMLMKLFCKKKSFTYG